MAARLISSLILLLLLSSQAWATTYYVRNDGGTISQCDGKTDHALAGATGTNCAVIHPSWVLGTGSAGVFSSGDTLVIDNVDEAVGSGQAKYVVGYTMPNLSGCNVNADDYDCAMHSVPAGIDSSHPTRILGKGYANCSTTATNTKAQLWAQGRADIMSFAGSNVDVECLELTDHSSCIENGPSDGNTISGDPVKCVRTGVGSTDGNWGGTALDFTSVLGYDNVTISNVDIHGMAARGIFARRMNNITVTNSNISANAYVGWDSDLSNGCTTSGFPFTRPAGCTAHDNSNGTTDCTTTHVSGQSDQSCASCTADVANGCYWRKDDYTGSVILDHTQITFSGCGENYPRTNWDWTSTTDLHHCWSQSQGGYGDGIGLGDGPSGDWIIKNQSNISWNVSDGVDLLHSGSGTLLMSRSRAEGNAGQQVKSSVALTHVEHSVIDGDCGFFRGQTFTSTKDVNGTSVAFDTCRANGDTITFSASAGSKFYINDSTILSNGDSAIISSGSGCDAGTVLQLRNSAVLAGRQFNDDTAINGAGGNDTTGFYYASGSDGNGAGTCGALAIDEDYNIIYGAKASTQQCTGADSAHSICNQAPSFVTSFSMGPTTYQTTPNAITNFYLNSNSPAVNLADTTISTLQLGSQDYNNSGRGAQWDNGAFEYGTIATCSNGVQDGDETGVDCGGSCGSCSGGGGGGSTATITKQLYGTIRGSIN